MPAINRRVVRQPRMATAATAPVPVSAAAEVPQIKADFCCICRDADFSGENADGRFYEGLNPGTVNGELIEPCACTGSIKIHVACLGHVIYRADYYPREIPICKSCKHQYIPSYVLDSPATKGSTISLMAQYAKEQLFYGALLAIFSVLMVAAFIGSIQYYVERYGGLVFGYHYVFMLGMLGFAYHVWKMFNRFVDHMWGLVPYTQWLINNGLAYRRVHLNPNAFR